MEKACQFMEKSCQFYSEKVMDNMGHFCTFEFHSKVYDRKRSKPYPHKIIFYLNSKGLEFRPLDKSKTIHKFDFVVFKNVFDVAIFELQKFLVSNNQ